MKHHTTKRIALLTIAIVIFCLVIFSVLLIVHFTMERLDQNVAIDDSCRDLIQMELMHVMRQTITVTVMGSFVLFTIGVVYERKKTKSDALTGLLSRENIRQDLFYLTKHQKGYAICTIDLNDFKSINTKYGHLGGDLYLKNFAVELKKLPVNVTAYRYGGDEFICIICSDSPAEIQVIVAEIQKICQRQVVLTNTEQEVELVNFDFSIGISIYPNNCISRKDSIEDVIKELVRVADFHCMRSKKIKQGVGN